MDHEEHRKFGGTDAGAFCDQHFFCSFRPLWSTLKHASRLDGKIAAGIAGLS